MSAELLPPSTLTKLSIIVTQTEDKQRIPANELIARVSKNMSVAVALVSSVLSLDRLTFRLVEATVHSCSTEELLWCCRLKL